MPLHDKASPPSDHEEIALLNAKIFELEQQIERLSEMSANAHKQAAIWAAFSTQLSKTAGLQWLRNQGVELPDATDIKSMCLKNGEKISGVS